jgi:hypothetical protein
MKKCAFCFVIGIAMIASTRLVGTAIAKDGICPKPKPGCVQTEDLADDAVTGAKIDDNAVDYNHIKSGGVITENIADGAVTKDKLDPAVQDQLGRSGISGYEIKTVQTPFLDIGSNQFGDISVDCPAGKKVLGGGCSGTDQYVSFFGSAPVDGDTWKCSYRNDNSGALQFTVTVYAICADAN